jgi:hypothetical protein
MNQSNLFNLERRLYRLDGFIAVPCTLEEWGEMMERKDRQVGDEMVGESRISTLFLGVDHAHTGGNPTLFETMVFEPDGQSTRCHRCSTWSEAEAMHQAMVDLVTAEQAFEQIERRAKRRLVKNMPGNE